MTLTDDWSGAAAAALRPWPPAARQPPGVAVSRVGRSESVERERVLAQDQLRARWAARCVRSAPSASASAHRATIARQAGRAQGRLPLLHDLPSDDCVPQMTRRERPGEIVQWFGRLCLAGSGESWLTAEASTLPWMLPASTSADLIAESGPRGLLAGIGHSAHQPLLSPDRPGQQQRSGRPAEWGWCDVCRLRWRL
jgi:hypothetical protein